MAAASDVKVLGSWSSPYVIRTRIALNLKNIDYQFLQETFGTGKSELLLKSNPVYKKIPVLIHNGKPVCESLIIVQYVDEVFTGPSILPSDPYDRALARFWAAYVDDKWFASMQGIAAGKTDQEKKTAMEGVSTGLELLEDAFQKLRQGKGFFGGETIGYLDIAVGSCLGWLRVAEKLSGTTFIDEIKTPGLYGWADRFCSAPAVKDLIPVTEKLLEFIKMVFAKMSASALK
ncbi:Glutathione s-transferase u18 [Thalictrum thalictroides]|uniref:Glutathione S-transferase n=1 Tax=Thalictrum thalictroides TaxID=46969 RepID=A0A7J6WPQ7_THATH|nr:Glutathione s-transferase u18 [Thalictrum thalictroides]